MNNKFIDYIRDNYGIDNFISWLWDWQKTQEWDFPNWIWSDVPREVLDEYLIKRQMYRGLYIPLSEIINTGGCSWSLSYDKALEFAEDNDYRIDIDERSEEEPKAIVFVKDSICIDLNKMYTDFQNLVSGSGIWGFKTPIFDNEEEVISDFKLDEVEIIYIK